MTDQLYFLRAEAETPAGRRWAGRLISRQLLEDVLPGPWVALGAMARGISARLEAEGADPRRMEWQITTERFPTLEETHT